MNDRQFYVNFLERENFRSLFEFWKIYWIRKPKRNYK